MNILHLNTYDIGGAPRATYRFHQGLKTDGHNSKILVFKKREINDADIIQFKLSPIGRLRHYFNEIIRRAVSLNFNKEYNFFNVDERIGFPTKYFIDNLPFKPDIICVHWISGFVNAKNIYELNKSTGAPIIWRFNDMSAFTGGCHYANGCTNYYNECGNCPALSKPFPKDRSWHNLQTKLSWLGKTNIHFLSSTTEIDTQLRNSAIARVAKTTKIILGGSTHFFKPSNKNEAAEALGLPTNRKIIFFGAQNISDPRKGFKQLVEIMTVLKTILSAEMQEKVLLVFASRSDKVIDNWPFEHVQIPYLQGEKELAKAYQAATLFVSPSIEDAGPMMLLESTLCGTPVVAFEIGLAKDAIIDNRTGYIVPTFDLNIFAQSIKKILMLEDNDYTKISYECAETAYKLFNEQRETDEYINLFTQLINEKPDVR